MSEKKQKRFAVHPISGISLLNSDGSATPFAPLGQKIETGKTWWVITIHGVPREFRVESVAMVPGFTHRLTVYGKTMYLGMTDIPVEVWLYPNGSRYLAIDRRQTVSVGQIVAGAQALISRRSWHLDATH